VGVLVPVALLVLAGTGMSACGSDGKVTLELDQTDPLPDGVSSDAVEDIPGTGDVTGKEIADEDAVESDAPADNGSPPGCEEGDTQCIAGRLATCTPPYGWLLEDCPPGSVCKDGQCESSECDPLSRRCGEGGIQVCAPSGQGWSDPMPCPEDHHCTEGTCVPNECVPGTVVCVDSTVATCLESGEEWDVVPCDSDQICFSGQCIECVKNSDCHDGLTCVEGICQPPPLAFLTQSLPDGIVGTPYDVTLQGTGGVPPYAYHVADGSQLPAGLSLEAGTGLLKGTPTVDGTYDVSIELTDHEETSVTKEFTFTIYPASLTVVITTGSPLPQGEEGTPYSVTLKATGGVEPYIWGISQGALPTGLSLSSDGKITGTPASHGPHTFKVKAFDDSDPPNVGSKEFTLNIKIAPLEIIGDQQVDLWVTKIIVLPMVTSIAGFALPYNQQLQAKGGVKPYKWKEQPLPSFVSFLIPQHGIPAGLTLAENGKFSGQVSDPDSAIKVSIPFTQFSLTGFFFMAEVKDAQNPADSDSAIFLLPTLPVNF
jgi:hypothetical protein